MDKSPLLFSCNALKIMGETTFKKIMLSRSSIMKSPKLQPGLTAPPNKDQRQAKKAKFYSVTELDDINPDSNELKSARTLKIKINS